MGEGPIPWTAIMDYADRHHLPTPLVAVFVRVIEEMDAGLTEWRAAEAERVANAKGGR